MTALQLRANIEAAKLLAAQNFDRMHGAGAYERLARYSASDENRRNLEHICRVMENAQ